MQFSREISAIGVLDRSPRRFPRDCRRSGTSRELGLARAQPPSARSLLTLNRKTVIVYIMCIQQINSPGKNRSKTVCFDKNSLKFF